MSSFNSKTTAQQVLEGISLTGKKVIITGGNSGIGFAAATALAGQGAEVVLACRDQAKAETACDSISKTHPNASVSSLVIDLASFASIRGFADSLNWSSIDVLVCNAGVFNMAYAETEDGFESTVGTCHYGHAYLVELLMDKIIASNEPRVVMVSSESHRHTRNIDFDKFPLSSATFSQYRAYAQAKLCNALFARELHNRYNEKGLTALSLHPGNLVTTSFGDNHPLSKLLFKIASPFTKSPEQGAASIAFCAGHPEAKALSGSYIENCKVAKASAAAKDRSLAEKLWDHTDAVISKTKTAH
jgi:WW domain-containing oxidoreductase